MKQEQNLKRAQIFRFTRVKLMIIPPIWNCTLSQLFAVQCCQWEPIQNGQLIRIYKEISPLPPFETARALSQLFTVQCCQWEPIRNGQLIRIYKEIPVQIYKHTDTKDRYTPHQTCQAREWTFNFQIYMGKVYHEPPQYHSEPKAVIGIQLYILCSFIYVVTLYILSFGVEQLDRSVMHLFL